MPQRSIRFPDDLAAAIEAEAVRRGKPHTFSSVLLEWAGRGAPYTGPDPCSRCDGAGTCEVCGGSGRGEDHRPVVLGRALHDSVPHIHGGHVVAVELDAVPPPVRRDVGPKPLAATKPIPKGGKR